MADQHGFDWGGDDDAREPAPAPEDARESDPLGGRPRRASQAAGGLDTLWRRFREQMARDIRFREFCDRFRAKPPTVGDDNSDSDDEE
jgi:hypothetical protein